MEEIARKPDASRYGLISLLKLIPLLSMAIISVLAASWLVKKITEIKQKSEMNILIKKGKKLR